MSRMSKQRVGAGRGSSVSRDPNVMSGAYCLRGTRIPVVVLKARFRSGETISSIAGDYGLKIDQVNAAIRWRERGNVREMPRKQPPVIPVNAPMCGRCGKMFLECQCWRPPESVPSVDAVEQLAEKFHNIYQAEARRQGDVRHKDCYAELPENIKEFDRVLARYVIGNFGE